MSRLLVLDGGATGARAALLEDGRLLRIETASAGDLLDRVFLGRVRRIDPALDAAFVDLGTGAPAWLGARDARLEAGASARLPIARLLHEGEAVVVQITRAGDGDKGPRVTRDLRLGGLFSVLRPRASTIEASRRLDRAARKALRARAAALGLTGGLTLRRSAVAASDEALRRDHDALRTRADAIEAAAVGARAPCALEPPEPPAHRLLRRLLTADVARIETADTLLHRQAAAFLEAAWPEGAPRLERLTGGGSAFARTGVDEQIARAASPEVPLAGGGRLTIEPTRALIAIDVDGGARGRKDARALDLEAADEVARQIGLRDLTGTIVVDFVRLDRPADRAALLQALAAALRRYEVEATVHPIAAGGLVALTRPRRGTRPGFAAAFAASEDA